MNVVVINRPWISSFAFAQAAYSDVKLEQVHKLSRNFVASLNLGCGQVRHANREGLKDGAALYRAWVADWKVVYREVSQLIRLLKQYRRTVRFPQLTPEQMRIYNLSTGGKNTDVAATLGSLSTVHLQRLQETAQVLLNARYNAKLASAEARRREHAKAPAKEDEKLAA